MRVEVKKTVTRTLDTETIISVLRHEGSAKEATVRVDKELLNDAAAVIEALVKEKEREGIMCAECANEDCHCDCAREFIPKVQIKESRKAKEIAKEVTELYDGLVNAAVIGAILGDLV